MGEFRNWIGRCIEDCKTNGSLNSQNAAELLTCKLAEKLDGGGVGGSAGIVRIESLDTSTPENLVQLRDLDTGVYMLYGYFSPYVGSDTTMTFDNALVSISRKDAGTHLMCFTALNCKVNFLEILVDESAPGGHTCTRTDIKLLDLHGLIARVEALEAATTT